MITDLENSEATAFEIAHFYSRYVLSRECRVICSAALHASCRMRCKTIPNSKCAVAARE
jgi:hypothetical protein